MLLLILYSFLAGIITILSPCILPILPIVLSASSTSVKSKKRPVGIILGFIFSFTFFTLFLSSLVHATNLPVNFLRNFSIIIVFLMGLSLLSSRFQLLVEKLFSVLANKIPKFDNGGSGLWSGILVGLSLGLLWTPCVGPILASVIALAITGQVTLGTTLITLAYASGTALPLFAILLGGRSLLTKVPWLLSNSAKIQKVFGLITIVLALGLFLNWDRGFQNYILTKFPNYGANLTSFEGNAIYPQKLPERGRAPQIIPGGQWFNLPAGSKPPEISDLKGKVVLVDFWTYTCINCIRTLPYLKGWYGKYEKDGLVIIGVHSPEFEFEKDPKNVSKAIKDFGLSYPIVQDNNFATWRAFSNNYWPAKYLIDAKGDIRYIHYGEGNYADTEKAIQDLLVEANPNLKTESPVIAETKTYAKTPETYLGLGRGDYSLQTSFSADKISHFDFPKNISLNQVVFQGDFLITSEYLNPQKDSSLQLKFSAKDVYLVMSATESSNVKVFVDNKIQFFGKDTNQGEIKVDANRLYHLISLPFPGEHLLRLEFSDNKIKLFAFTFG